MKIYQINKNRNRRTERQVMLSEISGLQKAAGGEDMVILTDEAVSSYQRDKFAKNRELELVHLAMGHINDESPVLEGIENDMEFIKAEKLALLAELVIRVAPCGISRNIYGRVSDFVIEQLAQPEVN